jgi:hypothetical protein
LAHLPFRDEHLGDFQRAGQQRVDLLGDLDISYSTVLLAGWRGDPERALDLMNRMAASGSERGEGLAVVGVEYGKSVLYNGLAEYERAAEAATARAAPARWAYPIGRSTSWWRPR